MTAKIDNNKLAIPTSLAARCGIRKGTTVYLCSRYYKKLCILKQMPKGDCSYTLHSIEKFNGSITLTPDMLKAMEIKGDTSSLELSIILSFLRKKPEIVIASM